MRIRKSAGIFGAYERRVRIAISCDKYHDVNAIEVYKEYKNKLSSYAFLSLHTLGELVEATGRGRRLNNAIKKERYYPHRIEVFGNNRTCYCKAVTKYMDKHQPNDNVIMCSLEIDIMGNMKNIKCDEDCSEDIILNLSTGDSILSRIEKYNENKTICIFAEKIINEKFQKRFKNYEFRHKWISNNLSKYNLEKKIKKEINGYDDDPTYPIEKFYEYYGSSLEEIKRELEKYNVPREEVEIIADYKYKEFTEVFKNYPTLTYNECKKLSGYLMNPRKYKIEIRKYKIIHYKRMFYSEMMNEVKDALFTQTLFKHFEEIKNIDDDSLYDMFCACVPKNIVESITKELLMEIYNEKENVNKISCMISILTRKIKWIAEKFDFGGDKEERSKQVEDVIYRRLGILYCYKEFISLYRYELDFEKRNIIEKIDPFIDNYILMYEYILDCPLLIMTIQNNTDSVNGRTLTYSAKDISIEKMSILFDPDKIHKFVEVKKFYERYQLEMKLQNIIMKN